MPHSSGGGSHGGGYHSSSSHSSHSSYSSSSSSSYSSGPSEKRFSSRPYSGASRYVYYDNRGRYHNIYHEGFTQRADLETAAVGSGLASFIAIPIIAMCLWFGIFIPNKIDTSKYDSAILVTSNVTEIDYKATTKIYDSLKRFQDATGVTGCVQIVYESSTEGYYSLEDYAFSEYLRMFDDEYHWLLVVSIPDGVDASTNAFIDWEWEGMIGDELGQVIDYDSEDRFTEIMHKHILRSSLTTMADEIAAAYDEYTLHVMDNVFHFAWIIAAVVILLAYALIMWAIIHDYKTHKNMEKAVRVSNNAKEDECKYCGCAYIVGSISVCPHCGAAIPAHK